MFVPGEQRARMHFAAAAAVAAAAVQCSTAPDVLEDAIKQRDAVCATWLCALHCMPTTADVPPCATLCCLVAVR